MTDGEAGLQTRRYAGGFVLNDDQAAVPMTRCARLRQPQQGRAVLWILCVEVGKVTTAQ